MNLRLMGLGFLLSAFCVAGCSDNSNSKTSEEGGRGKTEKEFEKETRRIAQSFNQAGVVTCVEERAKLIESFEKHFVAAEYGQAAEVVRQCATTSTDPSFKELVKKAEAAGYEVVLKDDKQSAYSRLATLDAFENAFPEESPKYASLRHRLVEINAKEMKKEEERNRIEKIEGERRQRIEEARYKRSQGVTVGMSRDEVLSSSWGRPQRITRSQSSYVNTETWDYGYPNFLYFVNGRLEQIHN